MIEVNKYFAYTHLPPHLKQLSKRFWVLAKALEQDLPEGHAKTQSLQKLLEAKDEAVRSSAVDRK